MAAVRPNIVGDRIPKDKCREARRRRIEMRRFTVLAGATSLSSEIPSLRENREEKSDRPSEGKRNRTDGYSSSPSSSSSSNGASESLPVSATFSGTPMTDLVPVFGSMSVSGRSLEMEDAVSERTDFFRSEGQRPLHFFAVFDGHGGSHVATQCKEQMHVLLAEELGRVGEEGIDGWKLATRRCFERMDEVALSACDCESNIRTPPCRCESGGISSDIVGSTAVVAVLSPDHILVANCGDSRAVLSRGGRAIPLSIDHKPDRPDELARIEAVGGRVIYLNGARVLGILAMSRALGDKYLKPVVISEPEIKIVEREPEDECLILASDGLWDVLSNDLACDVARRCLLEGPLAPAGVLDADTIGKSNSDEDSQSRCSLAAALLTRLALGRKSTDNISVIVISLKRN